MENNFLLNSNIIINWKISMETLEKQKEKLEIYKKEYIELKNNLIFLPNKLNYSIMVPLGSMGFIPGKLIHSNEIMVLLGENLFVKRTSKQAIQIIDRRLEYIEKNLNNLYNQIEQFKKKIEFEKELIQERKEGEDEIIEIREEYISEEENDDNNNEIYENDNINVEKTEKLFPITEKERLQYLELLSELEEEEEEYEQKKKDYEKQEKESKKEKNFQLSTPSDLYEQYIQKITIKEEDSYKNVNSNIKVENIEDNNKLSTNNEIPKKMSIFKTRMKNKSNQ